MKQNISLRSKYSKDVINGSTNLVGAEVRVGCASIHDIHDYCSLYIHPGLSFLPLRYTNLQCSREGPSLFSPLRYLFEAITLAKFIFFLFHEYLYTINRIIRI